MTLIDVAQSLLIRHNVDDVDSGELADRIWDEYGPVDYPEDLTEEDALWLIDAAR